MKRVLFTPGPTEVPSEVLQAMGKPLIHHRTDEYRQYFLETTRLMQGHLGTEQPALTLSCSGSGASAGSSSGECIQFAEDERLHSAGSS